MTWEDVPGWFDFDDIYAEAVAEARDGAHFVEVGTLFGKSTTAMAAMIRDSGKKICFDAIDPNKLHPPSFCKKPQRDVDVAAQFGGIRQAFEHYAAATGTRDFINVITWRDKEIVGDYANGSLDFFFLDADHSYEGTKGSLLAWLPKMKPGAIFAGHDYTIEEWPGVKQAVDEVLAGKGFVVRRNSFWMRA
jgi:hypothetical protein